MDKSTVLKAFNKLFFEFLDDIITVCPTKEIKYARDKFDFFKKANPTILVKMWKTHIYDVYKDKIELKDIHFFIEKDYKFDLKSDEHTNQRVLEMIEIVRGSLRDMDEVNKSHCAEYVFNLSKLSKLYDELIK